MVVSEDEGPKNARPDKIPTLKPVFKKDGTVTAANASSINDGAAALVLMSAERAKAEGRTVLGRITGYAGAARKPVEFTIAPADCHQQPAREDRPQGRRRGPLGDQRGLRGGGPRQQQAARLDASKVNVRGGAVVLGHPIGASGARLLVTLLHTLKDHEQEARRGVAVHRRRRGHRADGGALVQRGTNTPSPWERGGVRVSKRALAPFS